MQFISFAQGKKTYALVAAGVALGVVQGLSDSGVVNAHVPAAVDWVLMFLGLGAARLGIQAQSAKTAADIVQLVRDALANIAIPAEPTVELERDTTGATVRAAHVDVEPLAPTRG